jgi:hypothetical protein
MKRSGTHAVTLLPRRGTSPRRGLFVFSDDDDHLCGVSAAFRVVAGCLRIGKEKEPVDAGATGETFTPAACRRTP